MANSPTDLGEKFVKSGMTLITQPASDRWLKMVSDRKERKQRNNDYVERLND
jgi:hypothetical protein